MLKIAEPRLKREIARRAAAVKEKTASRTDLDRLRGHGVPYNVTVSSWSNLRMAARLTQTSFEPGAELRLDAVLTEFGVPVANRARVEAELRTPGRPSLHRAADRGVSGIVLRRADRWTGRCLASTRSSARA